jgi:5-methylcytosine-specific restriction endonuclease McrA
MLDQLQALIANNVRSVEEAETLACQLAQTDWTAFGIPRSRCPLCHASVGAGELLRDPTLPDRCTIGCAACLEAQRTIFQYVCEGCGMRYRYPPTRAVHLPLCQWCYRRSYDARARVNQALIRAQDAGLPATLTIGQWLKTLDHFQWQCVYCQAQAVEGYIGLDHYLPLCLGGGSTSDNCVPCCQECGRKKGAKHPRAVQDLFSKEVLDGIEAYLASRKETL